MANTSTSTNSSSEKWYFTKEQLENTPSRKCGFDAHKELSYRQQAANFIQEMGQRLKVSQLCINTAIVYMHRFYVFHSFTHFPWYQMAAAALFLAAKVEEQPRKLEYVIRIANVCRNSRDTNIDVTSERYIQQSQDLVFNENVLLQTLGFDVAIDHPHTHVVRCCHLVRASKDLAQTSYFMASNSLHLTTMCIQYKPTVVACFCILVACKWSNWEIPLSNEKKEWYSYVDPTVSRDLLQQLTEEFLVIFEACPSRLKVKIMAMDSSVCPEELLDHKKKDDIKPQHQHRSSHESKSESDLHKHRSSRPHEASSSNQQQQQRERDRNRDRERLAAQQKAALNSQPKVPHGHHRPSIDQKLKPPHSRPPVGSYAPNSRQEPRDILREAPKDSPFGLSSKDYREHKEIRTDKDVQKRDYLLKSNVANENNFSDSRLVSGYSAEKRIDPNRVKIDATKVPVKHEPTRRPDETKTYLKSETENIKKHLSASLHDKNSFLNKSLSSTSQKMEKLPDLDVSKSVLKPNMGQIEVPSKSQNFNGNDAIFNKPLEEVQIKTEPPMIKDEPLTPKEDSLTPKEEPLTPTPIIKRPSLFSPEQTPPHKKVIKTEPEIKNEPPLTPSFSPLSSPITIKRNRNCSTSSSEPELRPVMKKIDQVEGFENLIRDTTIGINKMNPVSDIVTPVMSQMKDELSIESSMPIEMKLPNVASTSVVENSNSRCNVVNGLETNPIMISNLLKEAAVVPHLPTVSSVSEIPFVVAESREKEHHHHKSKKKNKEKHKHKDKDRSREEKEKKKKHKDKDREKHKHKDKHLESVVEQPPVPAEPIKLKIQKDRIQPVHIESIAQQPPIQGLKIKIPKDKLKTEAISELVQPPPPLPTIGIKLKIPKEKLNNCVSLETNSRKRDRERTSPGGTPPNKIPKTIIHKSESSKQNGRHPYNKVSVNNRIPPMPPVNTMFPPPPPPASVFFYQQIPPPPGPPALPDMSVPPPNYVYPDPRPMYPYFPHQGYMYPPEMFTQPPLPPSSGPPNPPLPTEAPPSAIPPPPPPE